MADEPAVFQPGEVGADRFRVRNDGVGDIPTSLYAVVVLDEEPDNAIARRRVVERLRVLEAVDVDRHGLY